MAILPFNIIKTEVFIFMIRLVFFAPYPGMQSTIRQVIAERPDHDDFQYEIIQDFFNNPLDNINADIAIARGFTAHTMQR